MQEKTCCFFGHREINESEELKARVCEVVEKLILEKGVDTFLFGSKSRFDSVCLECVTEIKEKYPHIKRVYVRAEYEFIDDAYRAHLLNQYDETYYPKEISNSGRAIYVERNCVMIDKSGFCIVYYDENNLPTTRKSGTKLAFDYAVKHKKTVVNCAE